MKDKIGEACRMDGTNYGSRNSAVGIEARLRAGGPGVRIPAGDIFFPHGPGRLWVLPSLLFTGCRGSFAEASSCPIAPQLASRLRVNGCIPLLALYANMVWSWTNLPFTSTTVWCVFFSLSKDNTVQLPCCSSGRRLVNP